MRAHGFTMRTNALPLRAARYSNGDFEAVNRDPTGPDRFSLRRQVPRPHRAQ